MSISRFMQSVLGASAIAALLAGCSGGSGGGSQLAPTVGRPNVIGQAVAHGHVSSFAGRGTLNQAQPIKTKSWMLNVAKNEKLVYYSDAKYGTVNAYSYPNGKPMGQLTGFQEPQGMCSVPSKPQTGGIWIANTNASQVLEYAHGGTTVLNTIDTPGQYPIDCAVDPLTGNLAVSNIVTTDSNAGSVTVYTSPSSPGTNYPVTSMTRVYFLSYDNQGNLFVDGSNPPNAPFLFAELPAGGAAFVSLTFPGPVSFPGSVTWDGQKDGHLVVCDQNYSLCYQSQILGSDISITATFGLAGASDIVQGTATKSKFIAPDAGLNQLMIFNYPAGTYFRPILGANSGGQPIGSALSLQNNSR
jgi:hypothetical protein